MNYGRGYANPQNSWTPAKPIPPENGIGQNKSPWNTTTMLRGRIPHGNGVLGGDMWAIETPTTSLVDGGKKLRMTAPAMSIPMGNGGIVINNDDWNTVIPMNSLPQENGIVDYNGGWNPVIPMNSLPQENGIVKNNGVWKPVIPMNSLRRENGIVVNNEGWIPGNSLPREIGILQKRNSWTPMTPGKPIPQRSNTVPIDNPRSRLQNGKWQDLVGIYQDFLEEEETLDLNAVAKEFYPIPIHNSGNQHGVASKTKRNFNASSNLISNLSHGSDEASNSISYFGTDDPANWDCGLLATIVKPKKTSTMLLPSDGVKNNRRLVPNSSTQVISNSVVTTSTGYNSKQLPADGFPVPHRPCYNLNSPPRPEPDAVSSDIISPFALVQENQGNHINTERVPEKVYFSVEEISTPAKDGHGNQRKEDADNLHNEQLQTVGDSSSAISTTQQEQILAEEGVEQPIDLNMTPQQKTPARRKKHRPKVIREGKPKRTPKTKDPKNGNPDVTPVKRKYVRKKGVDISETQGNGNGETSQVGEPQSIGKRKYLRKKAIENLDIQRKSGPEEVTTLVDETPAKSCRKKLEFDLERVVRDESQDTRSGQQGINLNANPEEIEQEQRINNILGRSAIKIAQKYTNIGTNNQEISTRHMQVGNLNMSLPEQNIPTTPLAKANDHALNVLARSLSMKNSVAGEESWRSGYNQSNQQVRGEGIGNTIFQGGNISANLEARELTSQNTSQPFASGQMLYFDARRGIKRRSFEQMHPRSANAKDSLLMYQKLLSEIDHRTNDSNDLASVLLEAHKKKKMQNCLQTFVSTEPSCITPFEDNSVGDARKMNGIYGNVSALQSLNSCPRRVNPLSNAMNAVGGNVDKRHFQPPMTARQNLQMHQVSSGMQLVTERSIVERSQRSTQGHGISSMTAIVSGNPLPATPSKEASRSAVATYPAKQNSLNQSLDGADKMREKLRRDALESRQQSLTKAKGRVRKPKFEVSVDDITYKLEGLCIYNKNEKERNALVPYRRDNAMILFEPVKKRKPRPKVDLDPETDRLWRLLMGKEGNESTETIDKNKEKWWEDERQVFRGRADSFIARMHLVQGDRRFSRWKGSVVDSVIGVFLTQNVSDHLSSSAFMSLAAKFAHKSRTTNETCRQDRAFVLVEEPIETILPNDSIKIHENIIRHPVFNQKQNRISEEEVNQSQDSLDSSTVQTVDEIRSSSGSNSEVEDLMTTFEASKEPGPTVNLIQAEKVSMFKELFSHHNWSTPLKNPEDSMQIPRMSGVSNLNSTSIFSPSSSKIHLAQEPLAPSNQFQRNMITGLQKMGSLYFQLLGGESISSLPWSSSGMTEAYHTSNIAYQQNEMMRFQEPPPGQYDFMSGHPTSQENFQPRPDIGSVQHLNNHQQGKPLFTETSKNGAQQQETAMFRGTIINAEDRVSVADKQNCLENTTAESNSKEHDPHWPLSGAGTNISKIRKGTAEDEKKKEFDWDSLRKQVLSNGEKQERSKDAMDSLDYEAMRRADVSEISDAIRERGMNNMLAERIKGFLDRLVRDHGSLDLEWLRDVPPDKAKDYLLSFRGLGLKSVECVRLLTLHHLAFPVDTNVGRIAVRLGWVPLQPLPESLQLHLLEMYPVLESIQKYLWPRLCKLDQLTLYELHYQMITFGKVFCTKSKPNCNACPMRAECRHFASAFASARLALPGPEEKGIVTSDAPFTTDTTAAPVVSRPMPLPPAENNYNKDVRLFGRECEPIIEEPTSPEPETQELSISDIEDQYYEDSDEIPTIKLDMEEFTMNLQNIIQDNKELQGDMSQALVALNPQAASIPTPKLKNVSRLRTEHQVYQLPDSHPLLEGLNKREPDDPSPYLLAIWTPGETANSVRPPEIGCQAQDSGKLCDRETCFSCNSIKEANSQVVRGTILIPCRTAMRGSFPLNGTYFQVNEMFADHASSLNPIDVPRAWIWNLPRRTVYFGTSVSTIFKGLTTEEIQYCFWRGFVCVRGFDQKTRAPRPLMARLHFPASKLVKIKTEGK